MKFHLISPGGSFGKTKIHYTTKDVFPLSLFFKRKVTNLPAVGRKNRENNGSAYFPIPPSNNPRHFFIGSIMLNFIFYLQY